MESLVESGLLEIESFHPGGLAMSSALASLCRIGAGTNVLDVACGSGETARFLSKRLGARVCGLDRSAALLDRAHANAETSALGIELVEGDALELPFPEAEFDVAICECTLCLLDKAAALREMTRVVRPSGIVGMHDVVWHDDAPDELKAALADSEGEEPETLDGWRQRFAAAGLINIQAIDKSEAKARWLKEIRAQLGIGGYLKLCLHIVRRWGLRGLWSILRSERIFSDKRLGYCIVVGEKPGEDG